MNTTWFQKGQMHRQRQILLMQIEARFGPASQEIKTRVEELPTEEVEQRLIAILHAKSLEELELQADE